MIEKLIQPCRKRLHFILVGDIEVGSFGLGIELMSGDLFFAMVAKKTMISRKRRGKGIL